MSEYSDVFAFTSFNKIHLALKCVGLHDLNYEHFYYLLFLNLPQIGYSKYRDIINKRMLEIEFFERTQDKLNILSSIKNSRAKEYVYVDGEYKKLNMQEIPYALRHYHIHELFAYYKGLKNRKVHWVIPFEIDCVGEYHQIPYDEYKEARGKDMKKSNTQ